MKPAPNPSITYRDSLKALVLLSIPAILATFYYFMPISIQQTLVLDHTNPRIYNFWTNAIVHEQQSGDRHLIGNIIVYLLLVFPCWILYIYRRQERMFWVGLTIILAISPFTVSASSYIAFHEIIGLEIKNDRGFSGVVGALAGFLLISILYTFEQTQEESVAVLSIGIYVGCLLLGLGVLTSRIEAIGLGVFTLVGIFAATETTYVAPVKELFEWGNENGQIALVLLISILVTTLAFAGSLPSDIISGSGLTNIVAHGAGLLFGMVVAGTLRYRHHC